MNAHYVYLLKSRDDGRLYIGDRTAPCGDPYKDIKYKGSSKLVTKEYKANCMKRVLRTFPTRKEAKEFEILLHKRYDVGVNKRFFNGAIQTSSKFCTKGIIPLHTKTKEWSDKCKAYNASRVYDKVPHTEEAKRKMSETWKQKYANGYKPTAKKKHTRESIELMRKNNPNKGKFGSKSHSFKPWFIKYSDGTIIKFFNKSKKEKSLEDGLPSYTYENACTRCKGIHVIKQGVLKGMTIGNL